MISPAALGRGRQRQHRLPPRPEALPLDARPDGQEKSSWLACSVDALWVSNTGSGTVSRIDPAKRKVVATIKVGLSPVNLDVVGREVWVPNDESNTVSRIDIATNDVIETIAAGANTAVVAPAAADVWVSNFDAGTVWRIRPG